MSLFIINYRIFVFNQISSETSVNNWVFRFKNEGIAGLLTKKGRGWWQPRRKPLLGKSHDTEAVLTAIQSHRQRISTAHASFESQGGQKTSRSTFRTFLKVLVDTPKREDVNVWGRLVKKALQRETLCRFICT